MPFTSETARAAAAAKKHPAVLTLEAQVSQEKVAFARMQREDKPRYYITSPLAKADDDVRAAAMRLELQVHPGPTKYFDEDGKQVLRKGGTVILLEGEGITTDKLWAEYLQQEWPELEISEVPHTGLAAYRMEIDEAKAALAGE